MPRSKRRNSAAALCSVIIQSRYRARRSWIGVLQVPAVFLQNVTGHQKQAGNRGENQEQGQPSGIGPENSGQHQKTQPVLDQRTEALQQGQRLGDGVNLSPVQLIVGFRMVIESQIQAKGLQVDQAMDLVLHPLGLHRPNPGESAGQKLRGDP